MGDLFKVELYRVLVSVGVGFTFVIMSVFTFNLHEACRMNQYRKYLSQTQKETSQQPLPILAFYINLNKSEDEFCLNKQSIQKSGQNSEHLLLNDHVQFNLPLLELQVFAQAVKKTMDSVKEYMWIIILLSIVFGEVLSAFGMLLIYLIFFENLFEGIESQRLYIDKDLESIKFKKLIGTLGTNFGILGSLSELYFSLSKGFAGVYASFLLLGFLNVVLIDCLSDDFINSYIYTTILLIVSQISSIPTIFIILTRILFRSVLSHKMTYKRLLELISLLIFISILIITINLSFKNLHLLDIYFLYFCIFHVLGLLSLIISIRNFQSTNQMLYIISKESRKKGYISRVRD